MTSLQTSSLRMQNKSCWLDHPFFRPLLQASGDRGEGPGSRVGRAAGWLPACCWTPPPTLALDLEKKNPDSEASVDQPTTLCCVFALQRLWLAPNEVRGSTSPQPSERPEQKVPQWIGRERSGGSVRSAVSPPAWHRGAPPSRERTWGAGPGGPTPGGPPTSEHGR